MYCIKKYLSLLILLFLLSVYTSAQGKCDVSKLSQRKKVELNFFWESLRKAIIKKDKETLAKLFNFPFNCSFCTSSKSRTPYLIINKEMFYKEYYKVFFGDFFKEAVLKDEILVILKGDILESGVCGYSFSFPIVKPSAEGEGLQGFLTLRELDSRYKIISAWSVP